tara:strand:+ start:486 stop:932 length:447 start_codon:yes stop_codon:yes gene_type:complete
MNRVIKMSGTWVAVAFAGALLTGCGGGGSSGSTASTAPVDSGDTSGSNGSDSPAVVDKTATLSWLAPDRRVNGEQISPNELISYTIRYGQDPNNLDQSVVLDDVSGQVSVSYTIEDLDVGTWYFTIQVQDASGLMSEPSEAVSKTIQS